MRIVVTGPPKAGKSTLATMFGKVLGYPVYPTDSLIDTLDWTEVSSAVATWLERPGPWIIEGVAVPRAIRKWRLAHLDDEHPPFDRFVLLRQPKAVLELPGQKAMLKTVVELAEQYKSLIGDRWVEL